jgi:hypothetical protein
MNAISLISGEIAISSKIDDTFENSAISSKIAKTLKNCK